MMHCLEKTPQNQKFCTILTSLTLNKFLGALLF